MKKVLVSLVALAVVALVAGPALADDGVQVTKYNCAMVSNDISVISTTSKNTITDTAMFGGDSIGNNTITTGNADATAGAANILNSNLSSGGCCDGGTTQIDVNNGAFVGNTVYAASETGWNGITDIAMFGGTSDGDNRITTGNADATAGAANILNSNLSTEGCCDDGKQIDVGNFAMVGNDVDALSITGTNEIVDVAMCDSINDGSNTINTGEATTLAGAITVVNTNITRTWSY